jgi:single-strand DNA-binding protein
MSLNRCEFIGYLGRDPEIRTMQSGDKVANFSIGVTKKFKRENGEKVERTEWVRLVAWKGLADFADKYLRKGVMIYVAGEMVTRKWQDQSGADRWSTEISLSSRDSKLQILKWAESGSDGGYSSSGGSSGGSGYGGGDDGPPAGSEGGFQRDLDDEIPF